MSRATATGMVLAMGLSFQATHFQAGQIAQFSAQNSAGLTQFRVAVDAVRIDVVVTDHDGRAVPDLTAADFEVRQDGKPQAVTSAEFIRVLTDVGTSGPTSDEANPRDVGKATSQSVMRARVQRTIAIVVDDLSMSFESFHGLQRSLHDFVDKGLRPTDLVAIVRSGGAGGGLQSFTTDRRLLHAIIDRLQWNLQSHIEGVESLPSRRRNALVRPPNGSSDPADVDSPERVRKAGSVAGTFGALNLVVQAARDLPGRKAVVLVTEGFRLGVDLSRESPNVDLRPVVNGVIDNAARAGVVIYALDCRGLQAILTQTLVDTQEGMAYLAERTGGFAVVNTNDLAGGLERIADNLGDYYLLGYAPSEGTFARLGEKPSLHKISVKVLRPGLRVQTRKEFLGESDPPTPEQSEPAEQLFHAATSPFATTDIVLRATALPGYSTEQGLFIRALLHIDARGLTFVDGEGGKKTSSVDVLGMVFDQDGAGVAQVATAFSVALTANAAEAALGDGLAYMLRIPIRRAGAYQLRFAVRDQRTGASGAAGEFVEISDVPRGVFALSGIVLRSEADANVARKITDDITVTPGQALGVYRPGTRLSYAYEIYNGGASPIVAVMSVWRGNVKAFTARADTLLPPVGGSPFVAAGEVKLGEQLPTGSYMLQITATGTDPKHKERTRSAVQGVTFEVRDLVPFESLGK